VVHVDLLRENWTEASRPPVGRAARATPRLRIRVARDGWPQADLSVRTGGAWPSAARLRREVVGGLGPAVLDPGSGWVDVAVGTCGSDDLRRSVSVVVTVERSLPSLPKSLEAVLAEIERLPGVEVVRAAGQNRVGARNAALTTLTGDVVVFLDGDVTPAEGWLDALLEPFADPSVSAVTGNVLPAEPADLAEQLLEDSGRLGGGPHRRLYDGRWLRRSVKPAATWRIGALANAAVRRDVLHEVGPFDDALGAEADAEYLYRILRADGRIVYEPSAVVLRDHRAGGEPLSRRWWRSAAGQVAYHLEILTRHGDARGLLSLAVAMPRQYARRAWWILRGRDDYPVRLLAAETGGFLAGIPTWLRRRTR
jgi:GT2 family glycosyltransferase